MSAILARRLCAHADQDGRGMHWLNAGEACPATAHEYTVTVPRMYVNAPDEPEIIVAISAHGGGTVGESYANNGWDYAVHVNGRELISGSDLRSAAMLTADSDQGTHAAMARTLCAFLASDGETLAHSRYPDAPELSGEYDQDAGEFLAAEHERLGAFASDLF
jgi:hypothetical protein